MAEQPRFDVKWKSPFFAPYLRPKLIDDYIQRKKKYGDSTMNDDELIGKVHSAMYHQCQERGYAAPVDVLMDIGVLSKQKYEE